MKKLLLILLLTIPLSVQGRIYAIMIGVSEYAQSENNLLYCHSDAKKMFELLKEYTATGGMTLLTNEDANHDNIVHYTTQLFKQSQPEDIVMFFFAGHGNASGFLVYDKMLYFSELREIFKQSKAERKMIFADACFSENFMQEGNKPSANVGKNLLLYLSSRSDQRSLETSALNGGVFTYYLIAGLKGEADLNKNGKITAKELYYYVNSKVRERTKDKQIPVMWGQFDENIIILKLDKNQ